MRNVPEDLARRVWELGEAISNDPHGRGVAALQSLRALYESYAANPDPFLTEALADRTSDAREAITLYEAALEQCAHFSDEPTYTKRRDLALRLREVGDTVKARAQAELALKEATRSGDAEYVANAQELLRVMGV
jgi:hypothetical protein